MHSLQSRVARAASLNQTSPLTHALRFSGILLLGCLSYMYFASDAQAQRAGQSATIQVGTVTGMRTVDLRTGNTAGGALAGGAVGAALSRNSSSRKRNRNAAIGAILGSAAARSRTTTGRVYTVTTQNGAMIQVSTEQTAIAIGDCVYVEQSGSSANIRRAPLTACEPATQEILKDKDVAAEMQADAQICMSARQELADAEDDDAFDRAVRKVKLLCYD